MKTIQERLRTAHIGLAVDGTLMREAADEIDRLKKVVEDVYFQTEIAAARTGAIVAIANLTGKEKR